MNNINTLPLPNASSFLPSSIPTGHTPTNTTTATENTLPQLSIASLQKRPRSFWDTVMVGSSNEEETPLPTSLPSTPTSLNEPLTKFTMANTFTATTNTSTIATPSTFTAPYHTSLPPVATSPVSQFTDSSVPMALPLPNTNNHSTNLGTSASRNLAPIGVIPTIQKQTVTPRVTRKPHTCNQCGSSFARSSHLRLHIRTIHEKLKPFQCEQCPAAFGHVSSKYRHFRTVHLKRRDFSCDRCGQAFAERSAVLKHCRTVHEGSRPYPCSVCGFRFHFKLHLSQHISTVHEKQRPHQCTICNACFGQRSSLNRHARQIHGVVTKK